MQYINQRGQQGYNHQNNSNSNEGNDSSQYHGVNNSNNQAYIQSSDLSSNANMNKNTYGSSMHYPNPNDQDLPNQNHGHQIYYDRSGGNTVDMYANGPNSGYHAHVRPDAYTQNYNEGMHPQQMQFSQQHMARPTMQSQLQPGMQQMQHGQQPYRQNNEISTANSLSRSHSGYGEGFESSHSEMYNNPSSSRSYDNRDNRLISPGTIYLRPTSMDSGDVYDPQGLPSHSPNISSHASYEYPPNYPTHTHSNNQSPSNNNQQYYNRPMNMTHGHGGYGGPVGGYNMNNSVSGNNNNGRYRNNQNQQSNFHQGHGGQGHGSGSNMQGRSLNKMLLDILRDRVINTFRLNSALENTIEKFDCVNIATLLFHTGKKKITLNPNFIGRIAVRLNDLSEELRAREASNAMYGLRCLSSDSPEVRQLCLALATKLSATTSKLVAQAVGNAVYGLQSMTSDHEEVRVLLSVLAVKVSQCEEKLEAQNVGNALYGLRGMSSDHQEVRDMLTALTPKLLSVRETLNGQAIGNSLYGLQSMCSREPAVREILQCLAGLIEDSGDSLNAQEIGNCLYGMKRMFSDAPEVRMLLGAIANKVSMSREVLDAQAVGNALYGLQNMTSDSAEMLYLLGIMAQKISQSPSELDGQSMGNAIYGLQGMSSQHPEVRAVVVSLTNKINSSSIGLNAQELGNSLYGLQNMKSDSFEVKDLMRALTRKVKECRHDLASQEIGNALYGVQEMSADVVETRMLLEALTAKIYSSKAIMDPQGVGNAIYGLKNMSGDYPEVLKLVELLIGKVQLSWKALSSFQISNCFYGLQSLSSANGEVRTLLKVLGEKLASCADVFTPKQLVNAIYGLKRMYSCHDEVLEVVGVLANKLELLTASNVNGTHATVENSFTIDMLCVALKGLQGMSTVVCTGSNEDGCPDSCARMYKLRSGIEFVESGCCNAVESLLKAVVDLYIFYNPNPNPSGDHGSSTQIHEALYAMQRMKSEFSPTLCRILEILQPYVVASVSPQDSSSNEYAHSVNPGDSADVVDGVSDEGIVQELSDFESHINIAKAVFGCQGLNGHLPFVCAIQKVYCARIVRISTAYNVLFKQYEQTKAQRDEIFEKSNDNSNATVDEAYYNNTLENFESMKNLAKKGYYSLSIMYQYCTLGIFSGFQVENMDDTLQECYTKQLALMESLLETHYADFHNAHFKINEVENHFASCLSHLFKQDEPSNLNLNSNSTPNSVPNGSFDISLNNLLYGFNSTILVIFQAGDKQSNPILINLEVDPELNFVSRPDIMWFASRRCFYLQDHKNVSTVSRVSAVDIANLSSDVLCDLICEHFVTLFGPHVEMPSEVKSRLDIIQFQRMSHISQSHSHSHHEMDGGISKNVTKDFADNMFVINLPPDETSHHLHQQYSYDMQPPSLPNNYSGSSDDMLLRHLSNDSFNQQTTGTGGVNGRGLRVSHSESFSIGSPLSGQYLNSDPVSNPNFNNSSTIRTVSSMESNDSNSNSNLNIHPNMHTHTHGNGNQNQGNQVQVQSQDNGSFHSLLPGNTGSPSLATQSMAIQNMNAANRSWDSFDREEGNHTNNCNVNSNSHVDHRDVISRLSSLTEDAADPPKSGYNSSMPPMSPKPKPNAKPIGTGIGTDTCAIAENQIVGEAPDPEADQIALLEAQLEQARIQEQIIQLRMKQKQSTQC